MSERSFDDMREDAIRRVMDMQRMTRGLTSTDEGGASKPSEERKASPLTDLLSGFDIDTEKAMIALLIYILWKNGADKKLLIGLGYLIL